MKRIIAIVSAMMIFGQVASASILGNFITSWSIDIADKVIYNHNKFMSEQSGVGQQSEHYAVYTPNEAVKPIVVSGEYLWGRETITQAEEYMKQNGLVPMIGVNASYFSYETGLPMGHVISNGKIASKDTLTYQSIGFNPDGTAFIAPLEIKTTLSFKKNDESIDVDVAHINKYNQKIIDVVNLYTSEFSDTNHTQSPSLTLVLGVDEGELKIGGTISATVEEKFNYDGSIKLPSDKLVITVNETAKPELYNGINLLEVGDSVTISSYANDSRWNQVDAGLGSVGETLVSNGEVPDGLTGGAAPRTAVGITASGEVIFYVIDGRQPGISYGAKTQTLAKRMIELGCVEAINLDGGGSTAISGVYPGCDASQILNSPSDSSLRPCTNYIFLHNTKVANGEFDKVYFYPFEQHYLSGYVDSIEERAADSSFYKTQLPDGLQYTIKDGQSEYSGGKLTARGTGAFYLTAELNGQNVGQARYYSYETPTQIIVYDRNGKSISELNAKVGDFILLDAYSKYNHIDLKSTNDCYTFKVSDNIGYFEGNKLNITGTGSGSVTVSAGAYTKNIPITVKPDGLFLDVSNHWAKDMIEDVSQKGIVTGYETEKGYVFKPDNVMTREEFAVVVGRFMEVDTSMYEDFSLNFGDNHVIADWSRPYIAAMYDSGIINGKQIGNVVNFAPKDTITRAEAITILGRTLEGVTEVDVSFADNAQIPVWAMEFVGKMCGLGYISGYEDNTIRPNNNVTRAEAVTLLSKML